MPQIRDRIARFDRIPAGQLKPNPLNWRTHSAAQKAALQGILADVGIADAVIARETADGYELIDGHLRADTMPDELIPTLVLDVNEDEARKLLLTIDPLAAMAGKDDDILSGLLDSVQTDDAALAGLLSGLRESIQVDVKPDPVDDEWSDNEPNEIATTIQPGDLFELGPHRLLCGDSTNAEHVARLMSGASINIAFTSPPYASQREYDAASGFKPIPPDEYVEWFLPIAANVKSHLAADGSWFVNIKPNSEKLDTHLYVLDLVCAHVRKWGWHFATEFCWERSGIPKAVTRRFKNQFEPIYQFAIGDWKMRPDNVRHESASVPKARGKGAGNTNWAEHQGSIHMSGNQGTPGFKWFGDDIESGLAYPGNRLPTFSGSHTALGHAAAFPIGLPSFFIRAYTDEADVVYDPFLGSGTTLIAADQLNRTCYGMEISPQYCQVIVNRYRAWCEKAGKPFLCRRNGSPYHDEAQQ